MLASLYHRVKHQRHRVFEDRSDDRQASDSTQIFHLIFGNSIETTFFMKLYLVHPVDFGFDDFQCPWTYVQEMMFN